MSLVGGLEPPCSVHKVCNLLVALRGPTKGEGCPEAASLIVKNEDVLHDGKELVHDFLLHGGGEVSSSVVLAEHPNQFLDEGF